MSNRLFSILLFFIVILFIAVAAALNAGSVVVSILAGAFTGLGETLLMYPLENVKTQQQLSAASMLQTVRRTVATDGFRGLYRGMLPILVGAIPTQALRWGSIELFCTTAVESCGNVNEKIIAGMLSGVVVAVIVGVPIETMKTEMIHQQFLVAMSPCETPSTVRTDEFGDRSSSLCRCKGWLPTVLKKVVNQSIRFPAFSIVFDVLCYFVTSSGGCIPKDHVVQSFVAGAFSGMSSVAFTQPIDVIKTRMQGCTAHRYKGTLDCLLTVTREEGWRVLLEGMWARVLRSSLGAGLTFTIFPAAQRVLSYVLLNDDA
jgi:solute carrier family 25 citrate transporter 1